MQPSLQLKTPSPSVSVVQATPLVQVDALSSQSTAARWTFYRRLGLLLRTRLDEEGNTLSLHEIAARTRGRVSADDLMALLRQGGAVASVPTVEEEPRTLGWREIAGLIEIGQDGSWRPSDIGLAQLLKLERDSRTGLDTFQ